MPSERLSICRGLEPCSPRLTIKVWRFLRLAVLRHSPARSSPILPRGNANYGFGRTC